MKLLLLLQSLQADEYKDFEKFLQSPFFKVSDQYLTFFRFLCKRHPSFELERTDLEAAYRRCFGPQSFNDSKLYNLSSGLSKQIEQYLIVRMVLPAGERRRGDLGDQLLAKSLGLRNTGEYFRKEALDLIKEIATHPVTEADDYLAIQQLHYHVYYNPDTPKAIGSFPHLQEASQHLDLYYCLLTLRYAAEWKTRERILNDRYELPLLEAVLKQCTAPGMIDSYPMLNIYYQLVSLYVRGIDEPGFRTLMDTFKLHFHALSKTDQTDLLQHLINCGIFLNSREGDVEAELLDLYKLALKTGQLIEGNRITHSTFINIANLASLRQEFTWATTFIAGFSPYLEESKRKPTVDLATAGVYYLQGQLDEAQTYLTDEKMYQVPSFDLLAKGLLLKIIFDRYVQEGKDYPFLIAYIRSLVRFVRSKALGADKIATQLNWIRLVRTMAILKFELVTVPESKKDFLRKKLHQLQGVVHKKWLKEKIASL